MQYNTPPVLPRGKEIRNQTPEQRRDVGTRDRDNSLRWERRNVIHVNTMMKEATGSNSRKGKDWSLGQWVLQRGANILSSVVIMGPFYARPELIHTPLSRNSRNPLRRTAGTIKRSYRIATRTQCKTQPFTGTMFTITPHNGADPGPRDSVRSEQTDTLHTTRACRRAVKLKRKGHCVQSLRGRYRVD